MDGAQGVHSIFEGMPGRPWKEGEKRASRMVFIGRNLDAELLKEGFQACLTENDVEAVAVWVSWIEVLWELCKNIGPMCRSIGFLEFKIVLSFEVISPL